MKNKSNMLPILKIRYESKRKNPEKLKALLEKIAEERNAEFELIEERFQTKYNLTIEYLGQHILFQNNLGLADTAWVICELESQNSLSDFKIDEKFLFTKLFKRKVDYLYVKSKDLELKRFIMESKTFKVLNEQAKADAFQPVIIAKNVNGYFRVETRYHLDFSNRRDVIEPLIDFYQSMIEYYSSEK